VKEGDEWAPGLIESCGMIPVGRWLSMGARRGMIHCKDHTVNQAV
jgi:hypothetical protein